MTYQEAIDLKNSVDGNIILQNNIPFHLIVAPKNNDEFLLFYRVFMNDFELYNDELCKEYCTNNEYILRCHITDDGKSYLSSANQ